MGNRLKILNGFLRAKLFRKPVILSHLLTQQCNLSCSYCLWKDTASKGVSLEDIKKIHADAARNGFIGVFLWGGEPLLRKDIGEILAYDRSLGLHVILATNGTCLEAKADAVAANVDDLLVSLDVPSEEHDAIRKGKGTFRAITSGIAAVKRKNPFCNIRICSVLTKHNKERMRDLAVFAKEAGCTIVFQHMDVRSPSRAADTSCDLSQQERDAAIDELLSLKKQGFPVANSFSYLQHFHSPIRPITCRSQYLYFTVWPNGDVGSCVSGKHIGNVVKTPMKEILLSEAYRDFQAESARCSRCRDSGTWESTYIYNLEFGAWVNFWRNIIHNREI